MHLEMLSEDEVIFLLTREHQFRILTLKSHAVRKVNHFFSNIEVDQNTPYLFADTRLLAIVESGRYDQNTLKITYYQYPEC